MTLFDDAMNKALRIQEERATRPGRGMEYLWYLSAAVSLINLRREPSKAEKFKHQAVDRMAKVLYKELSLLDEPSAESLASEVLSSVSLLERHSLHHAGPTRRHKQRKHKLENDRAAFKRRVFYRCWSTTRCV